MASGSSGVSIVSTGHVCRTLNSRVHARRRVVQKCMTHLDWYCQHAYNELQDMHVLGADGEILVNLQTSSGPPVTVTRNKQIKEERDKVKEEQAQQEEDLDPVACPHGARFKELHRNFKTWLEMPAGWKRRFINDAEPISCSLWNTKRFVLKGGKEPPQDVMNELVVFMTDVDLTANPGEERSYQTLAAELDRRNLVNNRRAQFLKLEGNRPDWKSDGMSSYVFDENEHFFLTFLPATTAKLHVESLDSVGAQATVEFRSNYSKYLSTVVVTVANRIVMERNVMEMFSEAQLLAPAGSEVGNQIMQTKQEEMTQQEGSVGSTHSPPSSIGPSASRVAGKGSDVSRTGSSDAPSSTVGGYQSELAASRGSGGMAHPVGLSSEADKPPEERPLVQAKLEPDDTAASGKKHTAKRSQPASSKLQSLSKAARSTKNLSQFFPTATLTPVKSEIAFQPKAALGK